MSPRAAGWRWTEDDVPDLRGRTAIVTGANSGIGFEVASILARHGANVVLACRNLEKAAAAAARVAGGAPRARVSIQELDLASLASVRRAAAELMATHQRVDLLVNNAGLIVPRDTLTEDGYELTLATNHLGHFALTGLLLERLLETPGSRVVTVSSVGHWRGTIDFDDLHSRRGYRMSAAYYQSKLANLLFTYELHRRLKDAGAGTIAIGAHPGNARTEFGRAMSTFVRVMMNPRLRMLTWWLMQSPRMGALPIVRAAVEPGASGGDYYGPGGPWGFTGPPTRNESSPASHDVQAQRRLWQESERLTGVVFPLAGARGPTVTGRSGRSSAAPPIGGAGGNTCCVSTGVRGAGGRQGDGS